MSERTNDQVLGLRAGDLVEVRSEHEILSTLDEACELDSLPFMPEMLRFCGQRFTVSKRAFKACDTIAWTGLHRMENAVHLDDLRCDGQAHGGCQAGCLIYWKEAWLRKVDSDGQARPAGSASAPKLASDGARSRSTPPLSVDFLTEATRKGHRSGAGESTFSCQATELMRAAPHEIPFWDPMQYLDDVRSGNAKLLVVLRALLVGLFNKIQEISTRILPRRLVIRGGKRYPFINGQPGKTPTETLALRPGELVRVKSKEDIFRTLDLDNKNRGMSFDVEMLKYCGREARVLRRVDKIIDEQTGRMLHMKNPCIVLEGVTCAGDYHRCCPRGIYPYWREIWLERVDEAQLIHSADNASATHAPGGRCDCA